MTKKEIKAFLKASADHDFATQVQLGIVKPYNYFKYGDMITRGVSAKSEVVPLVYKEELFG